ncbi:hypothetical protein Hanom_Chr00s057789g01783711 [Helianthus anomalus]
MSKTGQCGLNSSESRSLRSLKIACKALQNSRVTNRMVLFCFYAFSMSHGRSPIARPCTLSNYWWWPTILVTSQIVDWSSDTHDRSSIGTAVHIRDQGWSSNPHGGATSRTGVQPVARGCVFGVGVARAAGLVVHIRAGAGHRIRTGVPPFAWGCNAELSLVVASARGCHHPHGGATCPDQISSQNLRSFVV